MVASVCVCVRAKIEQMNEIERMAAAAFAECVVLSHSLIGSHSNTDTVRHREREKSNFCWLVGRSNQWAHRHTDTHTQLSSSQQWLLRQFKFSNSRWTTHLTCNFVLSSSSFHYYHYYNWSVKLLLLSDIVIIIISLLLLFNFNTLILFNQVSRSSINY